MPKPLHKKRERAKRFTIGFDIGGTHLRGVLWNGSRIVRSVMKKTPHGKLALALALKSAIKVLAPRSDKIHTVGIGIAGSTHSGVLTSSPNLKVLRGFDLRQAVPRAYKLRVDNDARAFLRGAPILYKYHHARRLLGLTIGTGIGRALALGGKVQTIRKLEAAETWEPEYQKRRSEPSTKLATYVAESLAPLIKRYRVNSVLIGGGVIQNKPGFSRHLKTQMILLYPDVSVNFIKKDSFQGARGAAVLAF
jgi:predicted NBD/HSP70 family sugar kinase